jgi:endonuclease/exonuclease/phosphatase (EEP) superfamily protein YafD
VATFLHPDLMVVGQSQGFVHGAFSPDGFGPHPRSRTGHVVRVWHPDEGGVTVGHMHGLRDPKGKMDTPVRGEQARKFAAMVQSVQMPGDPVVVCGDFNVLPGSETFRVLARVAPYNLVTTGGFDGTRTSHYPKPERWADYMLVNGPLKDAPFTVVRDPEVSDHCPLVLETAW